MPCCYNHRMNDWNATQYLQFESERTRPSLDLIMRIEIPLIQRIIDVGCGPGNSTQALRRRWNNAAIFGLDNSPHMIETARAAFPDESWLLDDAATWKSDAPFDLVFSNAVLQWLPHHETLIPHLLNQVAKGGALAVQVPAHYASDVHLATLEVADNAQWRERTIAASNALTIRAPEFYYDLLQPLAARIELWETTYIHVLESPRAVLDWFRATGLRPFLEVLNNSEKSLFENLLLEKYEVKYPRRKNGCVLFPFRRLFFIAYKAP